MLLMIVMIAMVVYYWEGDSESGVVVASVAL